MKLYQSKQKRLKVTGYITEKSNIAIEIEKVKI